MKWDQFDQREVFGDPNSALQKRFPDTRFALHGPCSNFTDVKGRLISPRVHGYEPDDHIGLNQDTYYMSCTNGWTCGNIAAPVSEISSFVYSLYGPESEVVSPASAKRMQVIQEWYGLGTMQLSGFRSGKEFDEGKFCRVGHLGVTYGFTAAASYTPGLDFALTWGTNQEDPGQTRTHGAVYDYLVKFDCLVIAAVQNVLNSSLPAVNCTVAAAASWDCKP